MRATASGAYGRVLFGSIPEQPIRVCARLVPEPCAGQGGRFLFLQFSFWSMPHECPWPPHVVHRRPLAAFRVIRTSCASAVFKARAFVALPPSNFPTQPFGLATSLGLGFSYSSDFNYTFGNFEYPSTSRLEAGTSPTSLTCGFAHTFDTSNHPFATETRRASGA